MLTITVPAGEMFDEKTRTFIKTKEQTLKLEHSLVSISKWETKYHKPFISKDSKTDAETIDYIRFMTLTPNVDPMTYMFLTKENIDAINAYIDDPATATTIKKTNKGRNTGKAITSELIYYWMISLNVPVEFEKWRLNRLLTLIEVCNAENSPGQKMSKSDIAKQNAALNAARRKRLNSKG